MLKAQRSPNSKGGLGFNKNEASTSGTKQVKFVKSAKVLARDRSKKKKDGSLNQGSVDPPECKNRTKRVFKPTTSFLSEFVILKKKVTQKATENTIRQPLRSSLKNGLGFVNIESRSKTLPLRRTSSSQPRSKTPQPRRNS
ncbi:hypothetical protein Tco_1398713, partial [Tanacetum coccineum]